jgi:tetratricopeptide (TPR) repeat protein
MGVLREEAMRFFNMAYDFQMKGRLEQAVAYYKKSLEVEPSAEAHTFLGWTYSMQGKLDEAIAECHRAIAIDPEFGNPHNDIGAYLMQQGKLDEAIPYLRRAMEVLRYDNPEFPHANLAIIHEMKGLWPLALEEYERALALRPDYKVALMGVMRLRANLN